MNHLSCQGFLKFSATRPQRDHPCTSTPPQMSSLVKSMWDQWCGNQRGPMQVNITTFKDLRGPWTYIAPLGPPMPCLTRRHLPMTCFAGLFGLLMLLGRCSFAGAPVPSSGFYMWLSGPSSSSLPIVVVVSANFWTFNFHVGFGSLFNQLWVNFPIIVYSWRCAT